MSNTADTDYQFVLCCLKHSQGKPDFHAVAKELGLKTHMTAYQRHWKIMKQAGMAGNTGKGRKAGTIAVATNFGGGGGQKRCRSAKPTPKTHDEESEEDEVKPELEDESNDGVESPPKKTKTDNAEDPVTAKDEFA